MVIVLRSAFNDKNIYHLKVCLEQYLHELTELQMKKLYKSKYFLSFKV